MWWRAPRRELFVGFSIVANVRNEWKAAAFAAGSAISSRRAALAHGIGTATPIESLPWPAASFDAVVSQYGIEYSDLSLSIPELMRVVAKKALQETSQRMATAVDPKMLRNSGKMLDELYQRRRQDDVAKTIGIAEAIRTEWRNHRGRLVAQIAAAVTRKERAELAGSLKRSGAREVRESDQMASGALIGHCIEASF